MRSVLVRREVEKDLLPDAEHFIQHIFDVEFFLGTLTNITTEFVVSLETEFEDVLEAKIVTRGLDFEAHFFGDLLPVAIFHAFFAQGHH